MKDNRFFCIMLLGFSTALFACTGCEEQVTFANRAPGSITIKKDKCYVPTSGILMLEGEAVDDDGDDIYYAWEAEAGSFTPPSGIGKTVAWTAPPTPGTVRITLKASDTIDERTRSIDVEVGERFPIFISGYVAVVDNGYPYILTSPGLLLVPEGSTLGIGPGVEIVVENETGGFLVRGKMTVTGTEDRIVTLGPDVCPGDEKSWKGITVLGRNAEGIFKNMQAYGADSCVQASVGADITLDSCWVRGGSALGVGIFGKSGAEITECKIWENGTGLDVRNSKVTVRETSIRYNLRDGVYLEDTLGTSDALFEGCVVANNEWNGFIVSDYYSPVITQCSIYSNDQYAVKLVFYPRGDSLKAENNFWGLSYQTEGTIAEVIYDRADSPQTISAYVDFAPWLSGDPNMLQDKEMDGARRCKESIWERLLR